MASGAWAAPVDDLRDCAERIAPQHAAIPIDAQCPRLDAALTALGLSSLLDVEARKRLNREALLDLAALSTRYSGAPTVGPKVASLAAIAAQINGKKAEPRTWWDRVSAFLRDWLAQPGSNGKHWLDEWLHRISVSSLLSPILYTCMALVFTVAFAIILIELRAAGILVKRRERALPQSQREMIVSDRLAASETSGEGVPRLLHLLVARLVRTGRLHYERALTHRELVAHSLFDNADQRLTFARVSEAAELHLYGGPRVEPAPQPLIEQGHALLLQLTELPPTDFV